MNSTPSPSPDSDPIDAEDVLFLAEMKHAGMEMMRIVLQQARDAAQAAASDAATPGKPPDFTPAFSRITNSIRQTMAMAAKLRAEIAAAKPAAQPPAATLDSDSPEARARERKLKREARSYIDMQILADYEGEEKQKMTAKLNERLADPAFMIEFGEAPIGVVVAALSEQLGINFNGKHFTDDQLGAKWPESMPGGYRLVPRKKVHPADFGYREEATAAYIAQGKPLPVIPPRDPPA